MLTSILHYDTNDGTLCYGLYRGRENLNILVQPQYYQLILNDLSLLQQ